MKATALKHPQPSAPAKPALRLVSTRELSREEWLKVRQQGIGSSDAAAAVGLSPYQSMLELWMVKTGRSEGLSTIDPNDDTHPTFWGTALEPFVAEHYQRRTGRKVRRINAVLQHADHPWMLANIDREVLGQSEVQILECKTAGEFGSRLWKAGVPEYVQVQVQHQLAVTGKKAADVCVLLCGQELQVHRIERDEELIEQLITLEKGFWHYVETDTPPPVDGSESAAKALAALYPRDTGNVLDYTNDESLSGDFAELLDVREKLSRLNEHESFLKQRIQSNMGEATKAVFPLGSISWKKANDSVVLDTKALLKDQPELLTQYSQTRTGARRFLVHAA